MFAHNGVSGFVNKGLLVNNCGGATICDNIITAKSKIRQSKASISRRIIWSEAQS